MGSLENLSCAELREILETLVHHLDEGVHVVDAMGRTLLYNDRMAEIESMHKQDVLDKRLLEVFRFPGNEHSTLLQAAWYGETTRNVKQTYFNRDGKEITTVNNTFPIRLGNVTGALEVSRDVTKMEKLLQENMQKKSGPRYSFASIIGESANLKEVVGEARRATRTNSSVLIVGETGTGKELFAQSIHQASNRATGPFVSQNCAALPDTLVEGLLFGTAKGAFTGAVDRKGLLEIADGGTLLLDELNALSPALQAKLLRVLQEKTIRRIGATQDTAVDVRILATINEDPLEEVRKGQLRKDLYYRLSVVTLFIPPLRDRQEDIALLSQSFVDKYNRLFQMNVHGVSANVLSYFYWYNWPGNVRELEHAIEGAMNMMVDEREIEFEHLPFPLRRRFSKLPQAPELKGDEPEEAMAIGFPDARESLAASLQRQVQEYEKQLIHDALLRNQGNVSRTTKELGLSRQSLQYRMKKWQTEHTATRLNGSDM